MAPHSSSLAWKIPWMEKPGRLQSMELQKKTRTYLTIKQQRQPSHFTSLSFISSSVELEKAMAPHSSTLAWKIPWREEPGRL